MKKMLKMGLVGVLLGLAAAVGTSTVGSEETAAAQCCSSCDQQYQDCMAGCASDFDTCENQCTSGTRYCYRWCSFSC